MSRHVRSKPPTLITLARATLARECGVGRGAHVVVAVSGGRDSMALLHVLAGLAKPMGFTIEAHGIDHGLREGAANELDLARRFAASLGVEFKSSKANVARGSNVQERARIARYSILEQALGISYQGATRLLATAHHADDRAETVLLRMLRGASAAGLAVLPPRLDFKIRPFIRASRDAINRHVARHEIPYADDPSNEDPRYLRTRVRHELLPLMRALNPGIVEHLCGIADDVAASSNRGRRDRDTLPRVTRDALRLLESKKNSRARIALPGGRVARFDRDSERIVVELDARPRKSH
jgi:tRNA(Ile)-lysidine synthase